MTLYYKVPFSILLLAICDANYCAKLFHLEQFESNDNNGVLAISQMGEIFDDELLNSFMSEILNI